MKLDYDKIINEHCLFDNDFMKNCFKEKPECAEFILKIILPHIAGLKITKINPEYEINTLITHSVCLDAYAVDENGTIYDIEIQRADKGASPKRIRYHGSLMDCDYLKKGQEYSALPIRYVIFISENGYKCNGKPLRQFSNRADDDGEPLGDETYAVYVNGANKEDTELGKLMQDMRNPNPDTMNYSVLSEVVAYFKKDQKGREKIMTISEKIYNAGKEKGIELGKQQGVEIGKNTVLYDLVKNNSITVDVAAKQAGLSEQDFRNKMKLAGY